MKPADGQTGQVWIYRWRGVEGSSGTVVWGDFCEYRLVFEYDGKLRAVETVEGGWDVRGHRF